MKSYVVIKSRNLDTLIYLLILTLAPGMEVYFCLKTNKCGYVKWNHTATVQQSSFFFSFILLQSSRKPQEMLMMKKMCDVKKANNNTANEFH